MLTKRTTFTTISSLPVGATRELVVEFLHDYTQMIDLNPLVKKRHPIPPPSHAGSDEKNCAWYCITDKISYLPGKIVEGDVTYTCAFQRLSNGLQTHCYAPAGLDLREKWTLNGNIPGEPAQPQELGIGAPSTGLYIREDVDIRCNVLMTSFVKKTLMKSHAELMKQLTAKVQNATATKKKVRRSSTVNSLASATSGESSAANSTMSRHTSSSSGWTGGRSSPPSRGHVSPTPISSQLATRPRPVYNPILYPSPAVRQQGHRLQTYFDTKAHFEQKGHVTPLSPPPIPPKAPGHGTSPVSENLQRQEKTMRSSSQPYQLPRLPLVPEKHTPNYLPRQPWAPELKRRHYQPRRSSIASTPISATDRSLIPDPLQIRPKSSGKTSNNVLQEHPDYPMMSPYTVVLTKSPTCPKAASPKSPTSPKNGRGAFALPARTRFVVADDLKLSASLSGPFVAELP